MEKITLIHKINQFASVWKSNEMLLCRFDISNPHDKIVPVRSNKALLRKSCLKRSGKRELHLRGGGFFKNVLVFLSNINLNRFDQKSCLRFCVYLDCF